MKKILFQLFLVHALLCLAEMALRFMGSEPGLLNNEIHPVDSLVVRPLFRADAKGLVTYVADSPLLPEGYVINRQGFRSSFDFDRNTIDSLRGVRNASVVFLIGDSYTEGCCASHPTNSFADILAQDSALIVLNFGVGTTGLTNYRLVLEEYAAELDPDLVVVNFYCGNDIEITPRPTTPNIPLFYTLEGLPWLRTVGPPYFMDDEPTEALSDPEATYRFYLRNYTLWSADVNFLGRLCRRSVLASKLYLGIREKFHMASWAIRSYHFGQDVEVTNYGLRQIADQCNETDTPLIISCIPAPKDVKKQVNMQEKYAPYFEGIDHVAAPVQLFTTDDYDGLGSSNHFNDSGHAKYAAFLRKQVQAELSAQRP